MNQNGQKPTSHMTSLKKPKTQTKNFLIADLLSLLKVWTTPKQNQWKSYAVAKIHENCFV